MTKWQKIIFLLILILAFILRFYKLGEIPAGFHADEAVVGYNAYSFLTTGRDEYGNTPSFTLRSFDDFRPALYTYLTIPAIAAWGSNEYAVRIPAAVFSFLTVVLFYYLTYRITRDRQISIYSTFLLAVSFWHLDLSREASEKVVALFLVLAGIFFLFIFKEEKRKRDLFLAFISWFLAVNTYYAPRFFLPPFLLVLFLIYRKSIFGKIKILPVCLILFFLLLLFYFSFIFKGSTIRLAQLNVFTHPEVRLVLEEQIREEPVGANLLLTRVFHNKIVNYSLAVISKYGEYFNLDFLVMGKGEPARVIIPNVGLLSIVEIPFLLAGIYFFLREKKDWNIFLLFWILIAPLPAAFTVDETPNVCRTLIMLPALDITTAYGFIKIKNMVATRKRLLLLPFFFIIISGFFSWNFFYYLHQYYIHQRFHRPWYRHYGYKELVSYVDSVKKNYRQIYITKAYGSPYIFFLFYSKYDPKTYWSYGSPRDKDWGGFDNYVFIPENCPLRVKKEDPLKRINGEKGILYVNMGECEMPKTNAKLLKTIFREDNTPAFQILEYVE